MLRAGLLLLAMVVNVMSLSTYSDYKIFQVGAPPSDFNTNVVASVDTVPPRVPNAELLYPQTKKINTRDAARVSIWFGTIGTNTCTGTASTRPIRGLGCVAGTMLFCDSASSSSSWRLVQWSNTQCYGTITGEINGNGADTCYTKAGDFNGYKVDCGAVQDPDILTTDSVFYNLRATDTGGSGVKEVTLTYMNQDGVHKKEIECTGLCAIPFHRHDRDGKWNFHSLITEDNVGNKRHYESYNAVGSWSIPDVIEVISEPDTTPPEVYGFFFIPDASTLDTGLNVYSNYTHTPTKFKAFIDDNFPSGVDTVVATYESEPIREMNNQRILKDISLFNKYGNGSIDWRTYPPSMTMFNQANGNWRLKELIVTDRAENEMIYSHGAAIGNSWAADIYVYNRKERVYPPQMNILQVTGGPQQLFLQSGTKTLNFDVTVEGRWNSSTNDISLWMNLYNEDANHFLVLPMSGVSQTQNQRSTTFSGSTSVTDYEMRSGVYGVAGVIIQHQFSWPSVFTEQTTTVTIAGRVTKDQALQFLNQKSAASLAALLNIPLLALAAILALWLPSL